MKIFVLVLFSTLSGLSDTTRYQVFKTYEEVLAAPTVIDGVQAHFKIYEIDLASGTVTYRFGCR